MWFQYTLVRRSNMRPTLLDSVRWNSNGDWILQIREKQQNKTRHRSTFTSLCEVY